MKLKEKQFKEIAEAIAESYETRGVAQVDWQDGWLNVKYEKGADVDVEFETGACIVSGAWCNIFRVGYVDEDLNEKPVDCDIEKIESLTAEYMNTF